MPSVTLPVAPTLFSSPRCLAAGEEATNIYLRGLFWCAVHGVAEVPSVALATLTQRPDAADLALRLVAAGLWAQTADGWQAVDDHRRHVSAVRAAAGRRSGQVRNEQKEQRSAKFAKTSDAVPDTTYARQSSDPSELRNSLKPTTTVAREESPTRGVVVVPMAQPNPEGERLVRLLADSTEWFTFDGSTTADRRELARRFVESKADDATVVAMATLCATPKTTWDWSTKITHAPVTVTWLLGTRGDDGRRTGSGLKTLVDKAICAIAKARESEDAARARAERKRRDEEAMVADTARREAEWNAKVAAMSPAEKAVVEANRARWTALTAKRRESEQHAAQG